MSSWLAGWHRRARGVSWRGGGQGREGEGVTWWNAPSQRRGWAAQATQEGREEAGGGGRLTGVEEGAFRTTAVDASAPSSTPPVNAVPESLLEPVGLYATHGIHVANLALHSYATPDLDFYADFCTRAAAALMIPTTLPPRRELAGTERIGMGFARLPTRSELHTVIKSPFVHKKSQENFVRKTHTRVIKCYDAHPKVIAKYLAYVKSHSMAGVGLKATVIEYHELGFGRKMAQMVSGGGGRMAMGQGGRRREAGSRAKASRTADEGESLDGPEEEEEGGVLGVPEHEVSAEIRRLGDEIVRNELAKGE